MSKQKKISKRDLGELSESLVRFIRDETGIQLDERNISFEIEDAQLNVKLNGRHFCSAEIDLEECEPSSLADGIMEAAGDIKSKLVKITTEELESALPAFSDKIRSALKDKGVSKEDADALIFSFEEGGHWPAIHGMTDAEVESGYPDIFLEVESPSVERLSFKANIYFPEEPVEPVEIIYGIMEALKK